MTDKLDLGRWNNDEQKKEAYMEYAELALQRSDSDFADYYSGLGAEDVESRMTRFSEHIETIQQSDF